MEDILKILGQGIIIKDFMNWLCDRFTRSKLNNPSEVESTTRLERTNFRAFSHKITSSESCERAGAELLKLVWNPTCPEPQSLFVRRRLNSLQSRGARQRLRFAQLRLPVDPFYIAQELGVKVYTAGIDGRLPGIIRKRPGEDLEIYLQSSDSRNRQRFTCAHALGHYVTRSDADNEEAYEYIEHRAMLDSSEPEEICANQFAASLLMPREAVKELKDKYGVAILAYRFGVSSDAMNFQLKRLNLN
jgi:hypothetical protein